MTSSDYPDDFELINKMQAAKLRAEDFDRHQRAEAGLTTGDGSNHKSKDKDKSRLAERRGQSGVELSALDKAMLDPVYAAAYQGLSDAIAQAETLTETAIADAKADIAEMEAGAGRLPDGRIVFKDKNGNVVTADGRKIDQDVAAGVIFPEGAASYEDYAKRKKDLHELEQYQTDIIGGARDAISDPDNPPSKDEIESWEKRVENGKPEILKPQFQDDFTNSSLENGSSLASDKPQLL